VLLTCLLHVQRTDQELGALLEGLWGRRQELDKVQAAVVRDARKEYIRAVAVPKEFAQRLAKLKSDAYAVRPFLCCPYSLHSR
jgi:carboxypeptidase Taq